MNDPMNGGAGYRALDVDGSDSLQPALTVRSPRLIFALLRQCWHAAVRVSTQIVR
jgi:hypothetical protein